jgi:hypothetical protein
MTKLELQKFIEGKSNRQAILKERMNLLNTLDEELSGSKIGRWFGNIYLNIKRFLTLSLGILLIVGSVLFFFFPQILFKNENVKKDIIQEYKNNFVQESGASLETKIHDVSSNYSKTKAIDLVEKLDKSIEISIETDIKNKFQFIAILVLILGLILLYIAHLTKKIKLRNTKISNAENISLSIIKDYGMTIDEEENELIILKELLNKIPN